MNNYILIFIYICILLFYFSYWFRNNILIPNLIVKNKEIHKKILPLLNDIQNSLERIDITYWMLTGGILGYIRHNKKLIPWDDDLDLAILYTDDLEDKIKYLKYDIENQGYLFENSSFGYQISLPDESVTIDLFVYIKEGSKIVMKSEIDRNVWINEYFYESELYPLIDVYINNQRTKFVREYKKFIIRAFGESSLKEAKVYNLHKVTFTEHLIFQFLKFFNYDYN